MDFEKCLERLEEISKTLESGEISLEESIKLFEEGMKLSKKCSDILKTAEQKISTLTELESGE